MTNSLSAMDYFAAKLAYQMSPEDLDVAQLLGAAPIVVDTRSATAWSHSHIPYALHIPAAEIGVRAAVDIPDEDADIVVYSWGLGSVDAARAALTLIRLGYTRVRELNGGFDGWEGHGFAVESEQSDPFGFTSSLAG
ncbi:MAG: rhodanese-like domain-containing protein [Propionibacteriaceae bacterium]